MARENEYAVHNGPAEKAYGWHNKGECPFCEKAVASHARIGFCPICHKRLVGVTWR